ncbi:MAG TPA: hypothetical protein VGG44_08280, partial [Tepidisphaeraceae bacterium]
MGEISVSESSKHGARSQVDLADESGFETSTIGIAGGLTIRALRNGCIYTIESESAESGKIQINQILASPLGGGIHRIYLRIHDDEDISAVEIVGPRAASAFAVSSDRFVWSGAWRGLHYRCTCRAVAAKDAWFFRVEVENRSGNAVNIDAVMVQDIGLAARGQVRNNENYTSQYLDHFAAKHAELGHVLMTRQNLPQPGGVHPWLIQGCFPKAAGFTTDGFDFFGAAYRASGIPAALSRKIIGERVRQYEAAYTAIQSIQPKIEPFERFAFTFFSKFSGDHPEPSSPADIEESRILNLRTDAEEMERTPANAGADAGELS